jgi:hypothetical protein
MICDREIVGWDRRGDGAVGDDSGRRVVVCEGGYDPAMRLALRLR